MTTKQIMRHLGYTPVWLEVGIITPELLLEQWYQYQTSEDKNKNTEHYRHGAFVGFLKQQTELSDVILEQLLTLQDDGGIDMRVVRVNEILLSKRLSKQQLQEFGLRDELQLDVSIQKIYIRQGVSESLQLEGLTSPIFTKIQHSQDKFLHELLLSRVDLQREHLLWLLDYGQTKAIRNRVQQLLSSKHYRV